MTESEGFKRGGDSEVLGNDNKATISEAKRVQKELCGHMRAINHVLQIGIAHGMFNASMSWEAQELDKEQQPAQAKW